MTQMEELSWEWPDVFPFPQKDAKVKDSISGILILDPQYRHEVLPNDPTVQVLTAWGILYRNDPERLSKVMNLSVVISKGRRALKVDRIRGQDAGFTVALDFHDEPERKSKGIRKNSNNITLFTLKWATPFIADETTDPTILEKHGSLLKDWELESVLFSSMPGYNFDDFLSLFHPSKVQYWDHDRKKFSGPTYAFWTDIDMYESGCLAIAWHELLGKPLGLPVKDWKDTTRLDGYPILLVLDRWGLPETEAEYRRKYIRL